MDFRKLLSERALAQLNYHEKTVAETKAMSNETLVGYAIHALHNGDPPRHSDGQVMPQGERSYDAILHYIAVPELISRLNGSTPTHCPICKVAVGEWFNGPKTVRQTL